MRSQTLKFSKATVQITGFFILLSWALFVLGWYLHSFFRPWNSLVSVFAIVSVAPVEFSEKLRIWGNSLTAIAAALWCVGVLWSCGRLLRKWALLQAKDAALQFCLDLGLGFFFLNTFWMGLGLARLWWEPLWLIGALVLSLWTAKNLLDIRGTGFKFHLPGKQAPWTFWILLGTGLAYFGFLLLHGVLPETFYDSLNYFLGMPHFWIFQHGLTDYPTHLLSGYFHGGSLFYLYAFLLGGTEGAKLLGVFVLGFNALFAFGWVREKAGFQAGTVAAVSVMAFPLLYLNAWAVRVDGLSTFTLLLFFYCLEKACTEKPPKPRSAWIWAAALFGCLALSIKPTAVVGILAALIAILWQGRAVFLKQRLFWIGLLFFGVLEVGPWLLKNGVFTGNPFFPYAASWMGGRSIPALGYARLLGENRQFLPMEHGFWSVLTLPWRLTMPQAGDGQWVGPLFLAFLPALFLLHGMDAFESPKGKLGSKDFYVGFFTKTAALSFVIGLCLSHMLRFVMPAFVLSLLLFSTVFFTQKGKAWKSLWTASVLACAVLFFGDYLDLSATHFHGAGIWRGLETQEAYLDRELPNSYEPLAAWTHANLPPDARLLIVGDSRGVYYERPYFAQSVFDEPFFAHSARNAQDPGGILRKLRQLGITHVVVNVPEGIRVSKEYHQYELKPQEWQRLDHYFQSGLKPLYWKNSQGVFEVEPQVEEVEGRRLPDPFSFFAPQAHDYFEDFQARNFPKAGKDLDELTALFPRDPYWHNQKMLLARKEHSQASAFKN
ncbi:MAG TPA: glycosyltransferase family 39 protein [bacterium]|nr:glycosyltransferase family 39 protein [bacterium]